MIAWAPVAAFGFWFLLQVPPLTLLVDALPEGGRNFFRCAPCCGFHLTWLAAVIFLWQPEPVVIAAKTLGVYAVLASWFQGYSYGDPD